MTRDSVGTLYVIKSEIEYIYIYTHTHNWLELRSDQKEIKILQIWVGANCFVSYWRDGKLRCGERQHTEGDLKNSHNLLVKNRIPSMEYFVTWVRVESWLHGSCDKIFHAWNSVTFCKCGRRQRCSSVRGLSLCILGACSELHLLVLSSSLVFLSWPLAVLDAPRELSFPSVHRSGPSPI